MMQKKKLTPLVLSGIFVLMLGLSYAAVPLYDLFCRVTGFGGTTQISNDAPKVVLNKIVSVRFDTNVNNLPWDFKARTNVIDVKVGQVNKIEFEVENYSNEPTAGVASFNVSPASFGKYYSKLGCFCFEKQELKAGEKATYVMTFYLDPEMVNDPTVKNLQDVTMSYTFFSTDYYKQSYSKKMSAEKKHDYHLVDPSPWPIYTSFSCLVLALGSVYYLHTDISWGMYLGFALLIYGAYMWFRDVVIEAEHQGHHTPVVQIHHRYGMTLFIASEVMFFVAWFWAYFDVSLFPNEFVGNVWPPKDIETFDPWDIPLINTLILLLSGTTVTWSHHALLEDDRKSFIQGLWLTVILGFCFTLLQIYEYQHASFSFSDHIYGSVFYMATGFHGFHVLVGTIFLAVCLFRGKRGHFNKDHHFGFEAAAWYWHFVDVVWLFLFAAIYIWGS